MEYVLKYYSIIFAFQISKLEFNDKNLGIYDLVVNKSLLFNFNIFNEFFLNEEDKKQK